MSLILSLECHLLPPCFAEAETLKTYDRTTESSYVPEGDFVRLFRPSKYANPSFELLRPILYFRDIDTKLQNTYAARCSLENTVSFFIEQMFRSEPNAIIGKEAIREIHRTQVSSSVMSLKIAVLIPCYNEEPTIANVINDFRRILPDAPIYVFDNNSSDNTLLCAAGAGAIVNTVREQGKGNVIRRMFADIESDIYILIDGDDTYDVSVAPVLVGELVSKGLDMVVACRQSEDRAAYRPGHRFGNRLLTSCVRMLFGRAVTDMLSGYRVFSRRFVKSFPAHAAGFETETEFTVHALELRMPVAEINTIYKSRPPGSTSKLNTYRDGLRILLTIFRLFKAEKPLLFFASGFAVCALGSVALAIPLLVTYLQTGLVPRMPTALLSSSLMLFGMLLLSCGIILDTVTRGRAEIKRLAYLAIAGIWNIHRDRSIRADD